MSNKKVRYVEGSVGEIHLIDFIEYEKHWEVIINGVWINKFHKSMEAEAKKFYNDTKIKMYQDQMRRRGKVSRRTRRYL